MREVEPGVHSGAASARLGVRRGPRRQALPSPTRLFFASPPLSQLRRLRRTPRGTGSAGASARGPLEASVSGRGVFGLSLADRGRCAAELSAVGGASGLPIERLAPAPCGWPRPCPPPSPPPAPCPCADLAVDAEEGKQYAAKLERGEPVPKPEPLASTCLSAPIQCAVPPPAAAASPLRCGPLLKSIVSPWLVARPSQRTLPPPSCRTRRVSTAFLR